ncbi:hypothetical protein BPOR_0955g00020 [Botrytis porri]|uniref:Uncharacterized protein n=1 Tax=Botrytis porri TaxID=87229 RepID=A0A4Z1KKJ9_9HELO|nr:hypothetical protein BPOR_0955g00020 [Botrytis porri]
MTKKSNSVLTIAACTTPRIGCFGSIEAITSKICHFDATLARNTTAFTPLALRPSPKARAERLSVPERDRKTGCLAPLSTIHDVKLLPRPPRHPMRRYEASDLSWSRDGVVRT